VWCPRLRFTNISAHDHQRRANRLDLCAALLLLPNEITDIFAVIGVVTVFDLRALIQSSCWSVKVMVLQKVAKVSLLLCTNSVTKS
jgi:hypothetical protein